MQAETSEVTIRRNELLHRWVIVNGSHESRTPWSDNADVVSVMTWLKAKAGGPVKVRVDLE